MKKLGILSLIFSMILGTLFSTTLPTAKAALSIGISPLRMEISADPGEKLEGEFEVLNRGETTIVLAPNIKEARVQDEQGNSTFVDPDPKDIQSLPNWITFQDKKITLTPGEKYKTKLIINVPETAEPGGHYGMVLYKPVPKKGEGVQITAQIGALILLRVKGDVLETGNVLSFLKVGEAIYDDKPIELSVRFENTGTVHLKPSGKVYLEDENGEVLKQISEYVDRTTNKTIITDYISINLEEGNILPNSIRQFTGEWNRNRKEGTFTASLELSYGTDDQKITSQTQFEVSEKVTIKDFYYSKDDKKLIVSLVNSGTEHVKPQGSIKLFNSLDFQQDEFPFELKEDYIAPGEQKNLEIDWDKELPAGYYYFQADLTYGAMVKTIKAKDTFRIGSFLSALLASRYGTDLFIGLILLFFVSIGISKFRKRKINTPETPQTPEESVTQTTPPPFPAQ